MIKQVDAHHHLWRYTEEEYGWLGPEMQQLRRDFLLKDIETVMLAAGVDAVVTVQARQTMEETQWLLELGEACSFVRGVVGWAPIASAEFPGQLERLLENRKLKGLRHVLQDEPDDTYMLRS